MSPAKLLERNVRPRRMDDDEDVDQTSVSDIRSDSDEPAEAAEVDNEDGWDDDNEASESDENDLEEKEDDGDAHIKNQISSISFGALKQAQDTLSRKRKRESETEPHEDKLEVLRERLRQIRESKEREVSKQSKSKSTRKANTVADDASDSDSGSDSAPSEEGAPAHARTSKHAPMSQTSKRQVTRRRQVVEVPKKHIRDPRFDALRSNYDPNATQNASKAYAFLRTYQESEIAELQSALKVAKTDEDRTILRRKLVSMQNTLKTEDAKQRERDVIRAHRKAEREQVLQGKTPYYLKEKEIKERALVEKFKGMKAKDRVKLMEKRKLKESQREKRRMPRERRRET